jgi:hypothetical protein
MATERKVTLSSKFLVLKLLQTGCTYGAAGRSLLAVHSYRQSGDALARGFVLRSFGPVSAAGTLNLYHCNTQLIDEFIFSCTQRGMIS